jgi:hypothetical protein
MRVCVFGRKAQLADECPLQSSTVELLTGICQNPPVVEGESPLQNTLKSWKKQNFGYGL